MKSLARLYHHYRARISLKGFMRVIGQPYWRLRDYLRVGAARRHRARVQARASAWVQAVATAEPTYGYRRVYRKRPARPSGHCKTVKLDAYNWDGISALSPSIDS